MEPLRAVFLLVLVPAIAGAQGDSPQASPDPPRSRHELLRRMREHKRENLEAYRPNRVEQEMLRFDRGDNPTIAEWNWKGFFPRIAWPARGSGAAAGFRYWKRDVLGPTDLAGAAFYSWRGYHHYDVQYGLLPHVGRRIPGRSWRGDDLYELGQSQPRLARFPFYITVRYRYMPQLDFYGLGGGSNLDDRSNFLHEESRVYLRTGYQFTDHVVWLVDAGAQWNDIDSGKSGRLPSIEDVFDESEAPGLESPPDYARLGTQLFIDYRDEAGNPHRGFMLAVALERYDDGSADAFSFTRRGFDARAYLPLGSPQRVLALRAGYLSDHADEGQKVPFFMQQGLGGSHNLRGFDSLRLRGEEIVLYQAEYRWEPLTFWELSVFTDAGTVAGTGSALAGLSWDWGFGTRLKTYRDVVLRMEIAFSEETTRYYFRGSASF